ncbi:hypothetical protein CPB86DRAFT_689759, partial [Serendipita vermifera]
TTATPLAASSKGRVSGKNWKQQKTATVRSHLQTGVRTKSWDERRRKDTKMAAVKALQKELKDEKLAEIQRKREITKERKEKAEEKKRLEEMKAKMSAKKLARMRRRQGRTKKING